MLSLEVLFVFSNHYRGVDNFLEVGGGGEDRTREILPTFAWPYPHFCVLYLNGLNELEKEYYSEVIKVAKLILVMPAANAL